MPINWWMDKPAVVYPPDRIPSHSKQECTDTPNNMDDLRHVRLNERSQKGKTAYCMIPESSRKGKGIETEI